MEDPAGMLAERYDEIGIGIVLARESDGGWHRVTDHAGGTSMTRVTSVQVGEVGPWCPECITDILGRTVRDGVALASLVDLVDLLSRLEGERTPDVEETCETLYHLEEVRVAVQGYTALSSAGQETFEQDLTRLRAHQDRLRAHLRTPVGMEWLSESSAEQLKTVVSKEQVLVGTTGPVLHDRTPEVQVLRAHSLRDDDVLVAVVPRHVAARLQRSPASSGTGNVQVADLEAGDTDVILETAAKLYTAPGQREASAPSEKLSDALAVARALQR